MVGWLVGFNGFALSNCPYAQYVLFENAMSMSMLIFRAWQVRQRGAHGAVCEAQCGDTRAVKHRLNTG